MKSLNLYTFIITSPKGKVLDFGTYHHEQCAIDTANESPMLALVDRVTIIKHNDDGGSDVVKVYFGRDVD